jgi:hypothetical protein
VRGNHHDQDQHWYRGNGQSSTAIKHQSDDDDGKHKNAMRYLEQYPDLSTKQIRRSKA